MALTLWCVAFLLLFHQIPASASQRVGLITSDDVKVPQHPLDVVHRTIAHTDDPLLVRDTICSIADEGVSALVETVTSDAVLRSVCERHHLPCLSTSAHANSGLFTLSLMPSTATTARALDSFITNMDWKSLTFFYDNLRNLGLSEEMLKRTDVSIEFVKVTNSSSIRSQLESLSHKSWSRVVLALNRNHLEVLLRVAQEVGLNSAPYRFIVANTDIPLSAVDAFTSNGGRLAVLRLGGAVSRATVEEQLIHDALSILTFAFNKTSTIAFQPRLCEDNIQYEQGEEIISAISQMRIDGATGPVSFSSSHDRLDPLYSLMETVNGHLKPVLYWNESQGIHLPKISRSMSPNKRVTRQAGVLQVKAILREPFLMYRSDIDPSVVGEDKFEGFCVDILDKITSQLGLDYMITLEDKYGTFDQKSGEWNGIIGALAKKRTHLGVGDITITRQRATVVDFTIPFRSFGLAALRGKTILNELNMFQFLQPFSVDLWVTIFFAFIIVWVVLFIIARLSPIERTRPFKEEASSWVPYNIMNTGWFVVSPLLRQTPIQQPRSLSTRFLTGVWWFFTLVVAALYFVTLLGSMMNTRTPTVVESLQDLATDNSIKIGALPNGSTWQMFKTSDVPVYQRIFNRLEESLEVHRPSTSSEAVDIVRNSNGRYVFIMEEPQLQYIVERMCDLKKSTGTFGPIRAYAFGFPKGSPYRDRFNDALLRLKESGEMQVLWDKWFKQQRGGGTCMTDSDGEVGMAAELQVENLTGAFIVLAIGAGVAIIIAIGECCAKAAFISKQKGDPFCGEVAAQLKEAAIGPTPVTPSITVSSHGHD